MLGDLFAADDMRRWLPLLLLAFIGILALWAMRAPPTAPTPAPVALPDIPERLALPPIILPTDPIRGPANASHTIVEFADFTCLACADVERVLRTLLGQRTDVRLVWKDLPHLDRITGSRQLHVAARCAQTQGKFWEFHDVIFKHHPQTDSDLAALADATGLDPTAFAACQNDPNVAALVDAGMREAERIDVNGTPTFFVDGKRLTGDPTTVAFEEFLNRRAR